MTTTAHAPLVLTFEERFIVALKRSGMNKSDFAKYVGTTAKTLWTWETLQAMPAEGALRMLALESEIDYEYLRPTYKELLEAGLLKPVNREARPEGFEPPTFWLGVESPAQAAKRGAVSDVRHMRNGDGKP